MQIAAEHMIVNNEQPPESVDAALIAAHAGHRIGVVVYDGNPNTVAIECEECLTTLHDLDLPSVPA